MKKGDQPLEKTVTRFLSFVFKYLREKGVSYLFAGEETIDCALLLEKLSALFPIKTLMIAGGGKSASIFDSSLFSGGSPSRSVFLK